ncbi:sensor histidine kinase [Psychromicrobium xiongbiense]|uniref:sensor histidine kinase n=1 Tax=Psychromicrobium xiongbiense TaxID=3051184 RepID=UPI00255461B7|nr:sensor histidine kinase [Psychromicrobium sp. YIM S02556]
MTASPGATMRTVPRGQLIRTLALIVGLCIVGVLGSHLGQFRQPEARPLDALAVIVLLLGPLSLLLRWRLPAVMPPFTLACSLIYLLMGYPWGPQPLSFAAAVILAFIAGLRLMPWLCLAIAALAVLASSLVPGVSPAELGVFRAWAVVAWLVVVGLAGQVIRWRVERIQEMRRRRVEQAEMDRNSERLALARDIHDVVAHSLATINVRASVALHLAHRDPSQVEPALKAIKTTSKEALDEVRELLGVLRQDNPSTAPLEPTAPLERLPRLFDQARDAGLEVSERINLGRPLSAGQQAVCFRVVQESLTNVIRHAHAHRVQVRINSSTALLSIEVDDDGRGLGVESPEASAGNGLRGMQERVSGLGGTLSLQNLGPGLGIHVLIPLVPPTGSGLTGSARPADAEMTTPPEVKNHD